MSTRACSRVYNEATLERWFEYVVLEWEAQFTEVELERGREIYREGQITGLELGVEDVVINCAFARKDTCYAVVEWVNDSIKVRASTEDMATGRAVAAAGLYEVEELIADEIAPLPYTPKEKEPKATHKQDAKNERAIDATPAKPNERHRKSIPKRALKVCFEGKGIGLRMKAFWEAEKNKRISAMSSSGAAANSEERERLVRFTVLAKEAGFSYRRSQRDFMMNDADRITGFFKRGLSRIKQRFGEVELDAEAERMSEGVQSVEVLGRVTASGVSKIALDWEMRLGEDLLTDEVMQRLARAGRGTHLVKGLGLVRIESEQSAALSEWKVGTGVQGQTWPRYMIFSLFGEQGAHLELGGVLEHWRKSMDPERSKEVGEADLPDFLREYQRHGVRWLANLQRHGCHGLLADEMGLGKTLQVLTLLKHFPIEGKQNLIVCPASVVPVWESEAARWYPELKTSVLRTGSDFKVAQGETVDASRLWIASYTQLRRHKHLLEGSGFGYSVLDEAQQIKNPEAKVTHACCAIEAECRIALTGTPLENRMLDLWTIFRYLMPGLLGTRSKFEVALQEKDSGKVSAFEKRLRKQISPFILRRLKDSVGKDLPPKMEMDLICPITDLQRSTYQALLAAGLNTLGRDLQAAMQTQSMHFFSLLTRLRQACCDPGLIPGVEADLMQSGKVQTLLVHLEEALNGDGARKVVVFSQFVQLLQRLKPVLKKSFPKVAFFELTGSTKDRQKPVKEFQDSAGPSVILVSLRAGGTGITLNAADYCFLLDPWWNPAVENQAVDRIHRIGQTRRVFVYRMITQGTVESRIQQLKREKRTLFENTLGGLKGASDLKEHFSDLEDLARLLPANEMQAVGAQSKAAK
ncbi:MAG: RNA polymerase-associated protein RapA [Opitutia bacterium UBA7350]|nr:MAG: RNA polymerase-associated protein RapA [Opitutae bacterium UBA7350]